MSDEMTDEEAILTLKAHNFWRRGAHVPQCEPANLGRAIDKVCEMAEKYLVLYEAAHETLDENGHLADGENCTLFKLKKAVGDWE